MPFSGFSFWDIFSFSLLLPGLLMLSFFSDTEPLSLGEDLGVTAINAGVEMPRKEFCSFNLGSLQFRPPSWCVSVYFFDGKSELLGLSVSTRIRILAHFCYCAKFWGIGPDNYNEFLMPLKQ